MVNVDENLKVSDIVPPLITLCTTKQDLPGCARSAEIVCRKQNLLGKKFGENMISWGAHINKTFEQVIDKPNEAYGTIEHLMPMQWLNQRMDKR